jgi:protein CpxP
MTSTPVRGALAALALALFAAAPAFAQPAAPPAPDGMARHGHDREEMHKKMEAHRAAMAQDLRTVLKLRPDQEAAFAAFQASMAPPPRDERMKHDHAAMETLTTPQKLDMMQARMTEHLARMQKHIQAVKTFYAALSPEQQHVFDALARMHGMHGGGFGGHEGGHGGHGGWGRGDMGGRGEGPPPPPGA